MSVWYGAEAMWVAEGMPHVTKIPRKPKGKGAEMKALADRQTKILIQLDVMEGKEHQQKKTFADIGSEGTAVTLRLTQPWFGSGQVVHADSASSSVKTCMALPIWPSLHGYYKHCSRGISPYIPDIKGR